MHTVDVAVGVENQLSAVLVALPFGNHFHVNTALDCSRDKQTLQRALSEWRQLQTPARTRESFLCVAQFENKIAAQFPVAEPFEQCPHLRKDRNGEPCRGLVPERDDPSSIKIDIGAHE